MNKSMAERMGLDEDAIIDIQILQNFRKGLFRSMEKCDPNTTIGSIDLENLYGMWRQNEFELQKAWGFELNDKFHRFWDLPHCTCPKMDNDDRYPLGDYWMSLDCPYHGKKSKK